MNIRFHAPRTRLTKDVEMPAVPRIGDTVRIEDELYRVHDVEWQTGSEHYCAYVVLSYGR